MQNQSPLNTKYYGNSSESLHSTSRIVVCSQLKNSWCSSAPLVIGNARRIRPQRCLCAILIPRRRWRHRRRSSGVSEYSAVSSSANSCVDFDGFSEATLASRSAVMTAPLPCLLLRHLWQRLRCLNCRMYAAHGGQPWSNRPPALSRKNDGRRGDSFRRSGLTNGVIGCSLRRSFWSLILADDDEVVFIGLAVTGQREVLSYLC